MLSIRFHEFGDPLSVLRLEEVAPRAPSPDELVVRMSARSINPSDLLVVRGVYGSLPQLPATPGLEGMGQVAAVGDHVTGFLPGQRVVPIGVRGTWQQEIAATPEQLIAVPDGVPDPSAAQLVVNPLSAWIMVVDELDVQPGEWLVQTAAASTLGRIVLQIARMRGFRTINVVRRPEHVAELKSLGADEVICGEDHAIANGIRGIAGDRGVTKAIDAVGGETGAAVIRALAPDGTMIVYGALSMKPTPLEASRMIFSTISVRGFWFNKWRRSVSPEKRAAVISRMIAAMEAGEIVPPVEAEYDLADFGSAIRHAKQPGRRGKVLLTG
jgi:NADPH2:quinone reductase